MNLIRCNNGHYYDSDLYASCPHCQEMGSGAENKTIGFDGGMAAADSVTVQFESEKPTQSAASMAGVMSSAPVSAGYDLPDDDQKTVSIYQNKNVQSVTMEPTVGWLVCTKGKFYGQDFRLKSGKNFIGRNADMDVALAGEASVSRSRHAILIHEPKQNMFIAQPGEARELFYINGNVVLSPIQIKKNDKLQVGEVELMLIPCCDDVFNWAMGDKE